MLFMGLNMNIFEKTFGRIRGPLAGLIASISIAITAIPASADLIDWDISGPGTVTDTMVGFDTVLGYELNPAGFSEVSWTASATAAADGVHHISWDYSGFHAFFDVTVFLDAFDPTTSLVLAGPENCCTEPSGGFQYDGIFTFNVAAGDVFGFQFGGSNFDSNNVLTGELTLSEVPLPASVGFVLAGLGALGLVRRRRKT